MILFACNFKAGLHVRHNQKHKAVYTCDKHKMTYAGAQAYNLIRTWRLYQKILLLVLLMKRRKQLEIEEKPLSLGDRLFKSEKKAVEG